MKETSMANEPLPAYLASAQPNPPQNRAPWYKTIAPSYAGIFLWIAFYDTLGRALPVGGLAGALIGLVLAGLISHVLFYLVFGTLGMKTGLPLYVVGSSTFGTKGGYLFPGIFMGILQIGWYSVATFFATKLVLAGLGVDSHLKTILDPVVENRGFDVVFFIVAIAWGYLFATIGAFGIKYVAKVSQFFPIIPLVMLLITGLAGLASIGNFEPKPAEGQTLSAIAAIGLVIQLVVGFFATAGAAGVDFGTAARDQKDASMGGWFGVFAAVIVAGGLAMLTVAGAHGVNPDLSSWDYSSKEVLGTVSPKLASIMLILFAVGSVAPACFCASIIGNSLSTMIPSLPRVPLTLGGATIGILLAATGAAGNLGVFFGLIGASFGPICGAIVADYLMSGKRWAGPREGVSIAGYAAWVIGFAVGISNNPLIGVLPDYHPTSVYSFVIGFVVYWFLASAGLQGKTVAYEPAAQQQAGEVEKPLEPTAV